MALLTQGLLTITFVLFLAISPSFAAPNLELVEWDNTQGNYQPRSQGFSVRTRRDTRKPWSGPVNFAFWLANTILSKNNWTWQLSITIQHLYFYVLVCTSMFCKIIFQSKTFSRLHDLLSPRPVTKFKSRVEVSCGVPDKTRNVYYYLSCSFPCTVFKMYSADVWWNTTRIAL
jgi:hypothetical protein